MPLVRGTRRYPVLAGADVVAFSPTDITGLQLWLKADGTLWQDSARTTPAVADSVVGAWDDESGNGNHATQATTSKKPLLKTNIVNGKPTVLFDTADDYLDAGLGGTQTQPNTIVAVAQWHSYSSSRFLTSGTSAGSVHDIKRKGSGESNPDKTTLYAGSSFAFVILPTDSFFILTAVFDGATSKLYENDTLKKTANAGTNPIDVLRIGATRWGTQAFGSDLAEILFYNDLVSAGDLSNLWQHLADKYGIVL